MPVLVIKALKIKIGLPFQEVTELKLHLATLEFNNRKGLSEAVKEEPDDTVSKPNFLISQISPPRCCKLFLTK